MKVNNINGTSSRTCNCGSWLEHWKEYSGQSLPMYCPTKDCIGKPEVGAHVQMDSSIDRRWYIIPLCNKCNRETGKSLEVADHIKPISANIADTCGK
jgi:hypothetical protein